MEELGRLHLVLPVITLDLVNHVVASSLSHVAVLRRVLETAEAASWVPTGEEGEEEGDEEEEEEGGEDREE